MKEGAPNNPWHRGDEIEAKMKKEDPVEYARMRLEHKIAPEIKELEIHAEERAATARMRDAFGVAPVASHELSERRDRRRAQMMFCQKLLKRPDATLRYAFVLDHGKIVLDGFKSTVPPDILEWLPIKEGHEYTANDVQRAAFILTKEFPEIHFEFEKTDEMIEYTASLQAIKE